MGSVVTRWIAFYRMVCKPELICRPKLRVSSAPLSRDLQKAKRYTFADCRPNGGAIHPMINKLVVTNGQKPIIGATVVCQFDFKTVEHETRATG
jgi:hypothetical protein